MFRKVRNILVLILLTSLTLQAQNLPNSDLKTAHFGFTLGVNMMDFGIQPSLQNINGKIYHADVSGITPGFTVGVIGDLRMAEYFNLRLVPCLHLGDRTLSYSNESDNEVLHTNIKSALVTIPLYVKYSAPRLDNYRFYLLAGGGISFDLARDRQRPVLLKQTDYYIEFGVGCTFYLKYFRISPELKYSIGFNDLLIPLDQRTGDALMNEDHRFTNALSKLTSRMFTIVFNFE
ncbi:MAG: porin family protein [Bacteroidales bacterium]|nr:porin family protein [Bacteroidales bacterium]